MVPGDAAAALAASQRRALLRHGIPAGSPEGERLLTQPPERLLADGVRSATEPLATACLEVAIEWWTPSLRAFAHQRGARGDLVDEVVQGVVLGLRRALDSLQPGEPRNPAGWLWQRVVFALGDQLRWEQGSRAKGAPEGGGTTRGVAVALQALDEVLGIDGDALGELITAERVVATRRALGRLASLDRRLLLGVVVEGRPYEELARSCQLTVAAAKMRVSRARKLLRELMPREEEA